MESVVHGTDSSTDLTHFTISSSSLPFAIAENALQLEEESELNSEIVITVFWTGAPVNVVD